MTEIEYSRAPEASALCKACGLCCSGHLFSWVRLRAPELNRLEKLGVQVIRSDPRQRGFLQPCPLWNGQCTIYDSPDYPSGCSAYNCKLLRELLDESVSLPKALRVVKRAKAQIQEVDVLLPDKTIPSFRERLITYLESVKDESDLYTKAQSLVNLLRDDFGITDLVEE
jgi:hypothetical protein